MPLPIQPLHHVEEEQIIPDEATMSRSLSALQDAFLGTQPAEKRVAAKKPTHPEYMLQMLDKIHKAEDETLTEATRLAKDKNTEPVYRVPNGITDYDLLALKAQSLITGHGRSVRFTSAGQLALRDFWFRQSNALLESRQKTRFVHPWAPDYRQAEGDPLPPRQASSTSKFRRTANIEE